jgi:uncharacterized protein (TIGR00297 family)
MTPVSPESPPSAFSETRRQVVHITMGGWALLLRWITWRQAAALALVALVFNLFVLPRAGGRRLYRASDTTRGLPVGILLYPLAVLALVLVFPYRLDIVAAGWGIMAAGDGCATLVGRRFGRTRLPWNPDKSVEGTLAFIVLGSMAGVFLAWWVRPAIVPAPPPGFWIAAPVAAAVVAALVESIPVRLDDNVSVPASAAGVLWMASLVSVDPRSIPSLLTVILTGLALNVTVAVLGWIARTVSVAGAITGAIIGTIIYAGAGTPGWILLLTAFVAASVTSRLGLRRKEALGVAEDRGGRRGPGNAIANTGIAACAAALKLFSSHGPACDLALTAALVAGASDTVASEIGKAWGRRTFLVTSVRPVPPGTSGAISLEGTIALAGSAALLGWIAHGLGLIGPEALPVVAFAAFAASFIESVLGATLEPRGILNNDLLNFVTTGSAAALALVLGGTVR